MNVNIPVGMESYARMTFVRILMFQLVNGPITALLIWRFTK